MTFRYIGSKARLVEALTPHLTRPSGGGRFVDLFCGTGAVAEAASLLGMPVMVNDTLVCAVTMAAGRLFSQDQVPFEKLGGYHAAVAYLNCEKLVQGVLWRQYSPASADYCGIERRYFTEGNAAKLDAMRQRIGAWHKEGKLSDAENTLLIADLLSATNRAANIAGTYGCFLSKWQKQALNPVVLQGRELQLKASRVEVLNVDAFNVETNAADVVYLDPPYTKRQYASYYHILETVSLNDDPAVVGVAGLRPWQSKSSPFCYKRKALDAMVCLVEGLSANTVLISYSDAGHIDLKELVGRLGKAGVVELVPLHDVGRYRPNRASTENGAVVTEYVIKFLRRAQAQQEQRKAA
jgi:adenine-specific DNA-methyltransferase